MDQPLGKYDIMHCMLLLSGFASGSGRPAVAISNLAASLHPHEFVVCSLNMSLRSQFCLSLARTWLVCVKTVHHVLEIVNLALESKLLQTRGYVLSGYPETMEEANELFKESTSPTLGVEVKLQTPSA
eukprot:6366206-Amphidinium_carterae.1